MSAHCKGPVILIWAAAGEILIWAARGSLQGKSSGAHFSDRRPRTLRSTSPHCRRSDLPRGGTSHLSNSWGAMNLQQDLDRSPQTSLLFWLLPDGRDMQERVCPRRSDTQARIRNMPKHYNSQQTVKRWALDGPYGFYQHHE